MFFFCLSIFSPGADAGFTKRGGGGGARCRPMWQGGGVLIRGGGGGRRSKHWPPGAGGPRYAIAFGRLDCTIFVPL